MRIAVVGTGGVGGYFGGRLAATGQDVTFVARGAHLEAIRANGLQIKSVNGGAHIIPAQVTDDAETIGPVDIVLVCVKTWDTRAAAAACKPLVGPETGVISLQNGIEKEDILVEALGEEAVMGGLCRIVSYIEAPGVIRNDSTMQTLDFGERDGTRSKRAEAFLAACQTAKIDVTLSDDILRDIWTKFLVICAFAGMTSLTRQPIGAVMQHPDARDLTRRALQECYDVGRARGINLPEDVVDKQFAFISNLEYGLTTSMQRDLATGNKLEVGALNGIVSRLGRELGVDTPVSQTIYASLQYYEDGRVDEGS